MTSGRVVPMDTTVAPISSSGRWNRRASAEASARYEQIYAEYFAL